MCVGNICISLSSHCAFEVTVKCIAFRRVMTKGNKFDDQESLSDSVEKVTASTKDFNEDQDKI